MTPEDAAPHGCQQHDGSLDKGYQPCNAPATHTAHVKNELHDAVYRFCERHSRTMFQQRDAHDIREYQPEQETGHMSENTDHVVPEEHSDIVGGSTAARRIGCPRSYALEQLVPKDAGSIYAREGTALHEMIAIVLGKDKEPAKLLPFTFKRESKGEHDVEGSWEFTVDQDLWDDVGQPALDAFDDFVDEIEKEQGQPFTYVVETRCEMPGIAGGFGTSDVIWTCGEMSGVWDWKFGRNPVSADENHQLMFYARAAASTMPHLFGPIDGVEGNDNASKFSEIDPKREVILSIMQPKCNDDPSEYIVTVEELEAFRVELLSAVKTAEREGVKAPVAKGKWCDFATCKAICPLWAGQSAAFGEKMAKFKEDLDAIDHQSFPEEAVAHTHDFLDALPELMDLADAAEEWIKTVRQAAFRAVEDDPDSVEGWRIGIASSNRRGWAVDDEQVRKFLKNRRYTLDEIAPRTTITMPAAEKLFKKDKKAAIPEDMVVVNTTTKKALVRTDSSLPAEEMSSERARALGDKIAAISGTTNEA